MRTATSPPKRAGGLGRPFGLIVQCANGIHGLPHKSEWTTPTLEPGTTICGRILDSDADSRRLILTQA